MRVLAAGVGPTDVSMLTGNYMYAPKMPFVPGYEVAGVVEAIGHEVKGFELDQRVAALSVHGGFAEFLVRDAEHLPLVQRTFPLLEARQAIEFLATGSVEGKVVLIG